MNDQKLYKFILVVGTELRSSTTLRYIIYSSTYAGAWDIDSENSIINQQENIMPCRKK